MQLCETTSLTVEKRKKNVYNKKNSKEKKTEVENWSKCRNKFSAKCAILSRHRKYWKRKSQSNSEDLQTNTERTGSEQWWRARERGTSAGRGTAKYQSKNEQRRKQLTRMGERKDLVTKQNMVQFQWFNRLPKGTSKARWTKEHRKQELPQARSHVSPIRHTCWLHIWPAPAAL